MPSRRARFRPAHCAPPRENTFICQSASAEPSSQRPGANRFACGRPTRAMVGGDRDEDTRADRQRLAVPLRLGRRDSHEHRCRGIQPDAVEQAGAHEGKVGEAGDRARPMGLVRLADLGEGALVRDGIGREQRQRVEDRDANRVERHQPERSLAVRPSVRLRGRGREETDERSGLGGGCVPLDPCVHGRTEPCVPASIPELEPQPVGVRAQSAVLLAELRVIRGGIPEGAAPRDPPKGRERPLVIEDRGVRQHRRNFLVDDPQESLREAMGLVSVVKHGLVERPALGMEIRGRAVEHVWCELSEQPPLFGRVHCVDEDR